MGCAASDLNPPQPMPGNTKGRNKDRHHANHHHSSAGGGRDDARAVANPLTPSTTKGGLAAPAAASAAAEDGAGGTGHMLGKGKYVVEAGAVTMDDRRGGATAGTLVLFAPNDYSGLVMAYRDARSGAVYAREFTDAQLTKEKDAQAVSLSWAPFFKSLASDVTKSKATITVAPQRVDIGVTIVTSKDAKISQPFTIRLDAKGRVGAPAAPRELFRYVLEPLTRMVQRRRTAADKEKELRLARIECGRVVKDAFLAKHRVVIDRLQPAIRPLREQAAAQAKASAELQNRVAQLERRLRRLKQATGGKHELDAMYDDGGARHFVHLPAADEHFPREPNASAALADVLAAAMPGAEKDVAAALLRAPGDPAIARLMEKAPPRIVQETLLVMGKLDRWDYNVFELERATDGNALFFTTYALLYKLGLVSHFGIDDAVLRNFLGALQAGYHPNPYHNATHAADVTHVNYFILTSGGLRDMCRLSPEDTLAAVLAGAIHDYDHPGFNNNFHTRTNAFLSTLYNDRSILENHHCACVFEMLRQPKYNFLAPLRDEQRVDVRDTIIEMVLSTDMGNHSKIFQSFRKRLTDGAEWHARRDDVRLALSMGIKMADISNCGRPNHLYVEWAKNIALEFYNQGDEEAKRTLSVSPFMDRRRHTQDFPKGQTSFMTYIVIPMFESLAEFLPTLELALKHCTENKDYWARQTEVQL